MDLVGHAEPRPGQSGDVSASAPQRRGGRGWGGDWRTSRGMAMTIVLGARAEGRFRF